MSLYENNTLPDNLGEWEIYPNEISWWIRHIFLNMSCAIAIQLIMEGWC